jgi:hypothetical protein
MAEHFEQFPQEQGGDHAVIADNIRRLLTKYEKISGEVDYSTPEAHEKSQYNKYRTAWFTAIIGTVEIMLDEGLITDESVEMKVRQKVQALSRRLMDVLDQKQKTTPDPSRSNDVFMTDEDVAVGEEILNLVKLYAGIGNEDEEIREAV